MLDLATRFLTTDHNRDVLAGFVSPVGNWSVDKKLSNDSTAFSQRFQMCKLACTNHNK
jgi:hypothetical protein